MVVDTASRTVSLRAACALGGAHTWDGIGRLSFGSSVRVESCDIRQTAYFSAG